MQDVAHLMSRWSMLALSGKPLRTFSLGRSERLFGQGDPVTAIYFVEEGRLRLAGGRSTAGC
jgi:CRP-like cAMP-binding protein